MPSVVYVGQFWEVRYRDSTVRMRVTDIDANGQVTLVEEDPETPTRSWRRGVVSSARELAAIARPAIEEETPTLVDIKIPTGVRRLLGLSEGEDK